MDSRLITDLFISKMRSLMKMMIVIQLIIGGYPLHAQTQAVYTDIQQFEITAEQAEILQNSDPGSIFRFESQGQVYQGYYGGLREKGTLAPCAQITKTCLPFTYDTAQITGTRFDQGQGFSVIEPGDPGYQSPEEFRTENGGAPVDAQGSDGSDNVNTDGPQEPNTGLNDGPGFVDHGIDVLNSAGSAAVIAGGSVAVINALGAKPLDAALAKYAEAREAYDSAVEGYRGTLIKTAQDVQQLGKDIQNLSKLKPALHVGNLNISAPPVDLKVLEKATTSFHVNYQQRVLKVAEKINKAPVKNSERFYDYRNLARDATLSSVESRTLGLNDLSEAQLGTAEVVADLLYGLDPVTGVHRGIYEAYTGKNLITGRALSDLERSLSGASAVLSLTTFGVVPGVGRAFKAVSMIVKKGLKNQGLQQRFSKFLKTTRQFVNAMAGPSLKRPDNLKTAEELLKKKIADGSLTSADQIQPLINQAIAEGKISNLAFKAEYAANPTSVDALTFIKNGVSSGGVRAQTIYPGTSDHIYIIGRDMGNLQDNLPGVYTYAVELAQAGFDSKKIHIFGSTTKGSGDFVLAKKELEQLRAANNGELLSFEQLQPTKMFQMNKKFILEAIGHGDETHTIIDLGKKPTDKESPFYDLLEIDLLKKSGRKPWK